MIFPRPSDAPDLASACAGCRQNLPVIAQYDQFARLAHDSDQRILLAGRRQAEQYDARKPTIDFQWWPSRRRADKRQTAQHRKKESHHTSLHVLLGTATQMDAPRGLLVRRNALQASCGR